MCNGLHHRLIGKNSFFSPLFCAALRLPFTPPPKKAAGRPPGPSRKTLFKLSRSQNSQHRFKGCYLESSSNSSPPPRPSDRAGREKWDKEQRARRVLEEKLDALQEEEGSAERGREWSREECVMVIQCVIMLRLDYHVTKTSACRSIARRTRRRYSTVLAVVNAWIENGELLYHEGAPRGQASENYPHSSTTLSAEQQETILNEVKRLNSEGQAATAKVIQSFIRQQFELIISTKRLCQQFRLWGGRYKKMKELTPIDKEFHERRVAQFIVRYAQALKKQADGTHVIVFTDESYAHNNHASTLGWVFPSSEGVNISRRDGRLIILHAITKDGLLTETNDFDEFVRDEVRDSDLNNMSTNAEYVYEIEVEKKGGETVAIMTDTKDDKAMYHGNIDSVLWLKWFEHRLTPAFKAKYPDKKMILVMDNASYHNPMHDDWVPPYQMNRSQLVGALAKYGIESFEGIRPYPSTFMEQGSEIVRFTDRTWKNSIGGSQAVVRLEQVRDGETIEFKESIPYNKEMEIKLGLWLKGHPEMLKTITRRKMDEMEGILIFTPPLEPECQPIELLWGMIKKLLASLYKTGRKVEEAREQLMTILYTMQHKRRLDWTGPTPARGVTASHCKGMIRKSEEFMNKWIRSHDRLIGELNQLLYPIDLQPDQSAKEQKDSTYHPPDHVWRAVNEEDWEEKVKEVVSLLMNYGLVVNEEAKEEEELEKELGKMILRNWGGELGEESDEEEGQDEDENNDGDEAEMLMQRIFLSGEEVRNMSGGGGGMMFHPMMMSANTIPRTLHPMFTLVTEPHILAQMPR